MNLHTVGEVPDWELVPSHERNKWQQRAAATNGWDTPGNRETAKGFLACLTGIACLRKGHTLTGAALMAYGRCLDIKDGRVAEATSTKGPKGAVLDPLADRVLFAAALPTLHQRDMLSSSEIAVIGAEQTLTFAAHGVATLQGNRPHARMAGKCAGALLWTGFSFRAFGRAAQEHGLRNAGTAVERVGNHITSAGLVLGAVSVLDYFRETARPLGAEAPAHPNGTTGA